MGIGLLELLPGDVVKATTSWAASAWLVWCSPCPCAGALHCTGREPTHLQSWTPGVVLSDAHSDLLGVGQWSKYYVCRDMWSVMGIVWCKCARCQARRHVIIWSWAKASRSLLLNNRRESLGSGTDRFAHHHRQEFWADIFEWNPFAAVAGQ